MMKRILKENAAYITLGVFFLVMFILIQEPFGDDMYYQGRVHNLQTLIEFLDMRYESWSSRLISETVIVLMLGLGMTVWRIFTTANMLVIAFSIKYLAGIGNSKWQNAVVCMMTAAFPASCYANAGWVTTTSVYLLSAAVGLIALVPMRKWLDGKKMIWWEAVLYLISAVIACNHEQVCAVLLGVYLCTISYGVFFKHKINGILLGIFFICMLSAIFILTCPGNTFRTMVETRQWLPESADWTFIEKLLRGCQHTANTLFHAKNVSFLMLLSVMTIMVFQKSECVWKKLLSGAGAVWQCTALGVLLLERAHIIDEEAVLPWENMLPLKAEIFQAVSAALLLLLLLSELYWLLGKSRNFLIALMISGAGFGSAALVGLSPTIYASGERIFTFCFYAVFLLISYLLKKLYSQKAGKEEKILLIPVVLITMAAVAKNIVFCLYHGGNTLSLSP